MHCHLSGKFPPLGTWTLDGEKINLRLREKREHVFIKREFLVHLIRYMENIVNQPQSFFEPMSEWRPILFCQRFTKGKGMH